MHLLRTTGDGVLIANKRLCLETINPAASAMLGLTLEQLLGQNAELVLAEMPALAALFTGEDDETAEIRLPRRRLAIGVATTLPDGHRLIILQDVTERRELDSRRESLVSTVAHDLRNPISAIGGFADLVGRSGELNGQQQHFLTRVRQTTSKLYDIAGSLVDLAWIEAGMPLARVPVDLAPLIEQVLVQLDALAVERRMSFMLSIQDPMPPLMGDPDRLRLVFFHLTHNALLYSEPDRIVAIHAWGNSETAYFSVADRGFGVAEDELVLIFDRLYRSRDERVRDLPGGGLGLTTAKIIVNRHGGEIWANSVLDEGSTFTVMLPANHA
jgi:two-component system phosphate regulon sensor histidine kinase PhoR